MKKNISIGIVLIGLVGTGVLIYYKLYTYMIVAVTVTVLAGVYLAMTLLRKETPESIYENQINEITKTYEPIIVEVQAIPEFDVKNIIIVPSFEKIADIQYEIKKPILFHNTHEASSFILMDSETAYVYTLKISKDSFSPVEKAIDEIEVKNKKIKNDKVLLEDLDKTTIIKLDNMREYKVSPIRKIELNNIKETEIIKEQEESEVEATVEDTKEEVVEAETTEEDAKEEVVEVEATVEDAKEEVVEVEATVEEAKEEVVEVETAVEEAKEENIVETTTPKKKKKKKKKKNQNNTQIKENTVDEKIETIIKEKNNISNTEEKFKFEA